MSTNVGAVDFELLLNSNQVVTKSKILDLQIWRSTKKGSSTCKCL